MTAQSSVRSIAVLTRTSRLLILLGILSTVPSLVRAQDNYEIQVYGSETVAPRQTMVELHTNYTESGAPPLLDGVLSTNHALHETIEITHGFNQWFETGLYFFTSVQDGEGWHYVGSHVRPRVRVPAEWHWPVGLSISTEIGFQGRRYSEDTWSWEIRPIIDKDFGRLYLSLNPALERSLRGRNVGRGIELAPSLNVKYNIGTTVAAGIEYYGSLGSLSGFDPVSEQTHQIYPSIDLNVSPDWELNAGVGFAVSKRSDGTIIKIIVGRRFKK